MVIEAGKRIQAEVAGWDGVTTEPGRFGSVRFMLGRRELGHVHGDSVVDLPFTRRARDELIAAGRVREHRFASGGWSSRFLDTDSDVADAIALLRMNYDHARER